MTKQECIARLNLIGFSYFQTDDYLTNKNNINNAIAKYPQAKLYKVDAKKYSVIPVGFIRKDNSSPTQIMYSYNELLTRAVRLKQNEQTRVYSEP